MKRIRNTAFRKIYLYFRDESIRGGSGKDSAADQQLPFGLQQCTQTQTICLRWSTGPNIYSSSTLTPPSVVFNQISKKSTIPI